MKIGKVQDSLFYNIHDLLLIEINFKIDAKIYYKLWDNIGSLIDEHRNSIWDWCIDETRYY